MIMTNVTLFTEYRVRKQNGDNRNENEQRIYDRLLAGRYVSMPCYGLFCYFCINL